MKHSCIMLEKIRKVNTTHINKKQTKQSRYCWEAITVPGYTVITAGGDRYGMDESHW